MNEWFRQLESRIAFFILGGAILFFVFLSLWQRNQMIHLGYEIEQLHQQKAELRRIHQTLLVEAESLSAIERVEQIAARQLKMSPILPEQRVYIRQAKDGREAPAGKGGRAQ
ncbi:MAG: cell division protein FtsL [Candidatus Manganitrophus sp. SA1]|nr:cell division protein FtsL [Candidatus Manganitrophus morganii]